MNNINELFSTTLSDALGWTLLHSLWQAGAIAVGLVILKSIFRRHTANFQYRLSMGAMLLFFAVIVITFISHFPSSTNLVGTFHTDALTLTTAAEKGDVMLNTTPASWSISSLMTFLQAKFPMIVIVWLIGMLITGFRLAGGYFYMLSKIQRAIKLNSLNIEDEIAVLCHQLGLKKFVAACEVDFINSPAVFGHLKPIILIPLGLLSHLSPEQVEMVLLHEIAHIKRHDFLANILQSVLEVIFFFNPAVWWMSTVIRQERENCCDDMIIRAKHQPVQYIKTLAALNYFSMPGHKILPGILGNSKQQLLKRMQRLVDKTEQINVMSAYKLGAIALLIGVFAWIGLLENRNLEASNARHSSFLINLPKLVDSYSNLPLKYHFPDTIKDKSIKEKEAIINEQQQLIKELKAKIEELEASKRNKAQDALRIQMKELELELNQKELVEKMLKKEVEVNLERLQNVKLDISMQMEQLLKNPNLINNNVFKENLKEEELELDKLMHEYDTHKNYMQDLNIREHERLREIANYNAEILAKIKKEMHVALEMARKNIGESKERMQLIRKKINAELKKDKLINKNTKKVKIISKENKVTVNGKKLNEKLSRKYVELLDEMFGTSKNKGNHEVIITFKNQ